MENRIKEKLRTALDAYKAENGYEERPGDFEEILQYYKIYSESVKEKGLPEEELVKGAMTLWEVIREG